MYVGSEIDALRAASVPHSARELPVVQPVQKRPPWTGSLPGGSTAVYHTTYSPVGALTAMGSCAKTSATTLVRVKGVVAGSGLVAWMTPE
jgi:hypothetical protein